MRKLWIGLHIILLSCSLMGTAQAKEKSRVKRSLEKLYQRPGVLFLAKKEGISYVLGGTWKEILPDDFLTEVEVDQFKDRSKTSAIFDQLIELESQGYVLFIKKGRKILSISKRLTRKSPRLKKKAKKKEKKEPEVIDISDLPEYQKEAKEVYQKSYCTFCQIRITTNMIMVDSSLQFKPEIAWVPYKELSKTTGLSFPISASFYSAEDENLQETISPVFKAQVLYRKYFGRIMIEGGGGLDYFKIYNDISPVVTFGGGYVFKIGRWVILKNMSFTGFHGYITQVFWDKSIQEIKVGINISF